MFLLICFAVAGLVINNVRIIFTSFPSAFFYYFISLSLRLTTDLYFAEVYFHVLNDMIVDNLYNIEKQI